MTDFWPDELGTFEFTPPRTILREQAEALGKRTKGMLEGLVTTSPEGKGFAHNFFVVVPSLDNYSYRLLVVAHPLQFYPLELQADVLDKTIHCGTEDEFKERLREVLKSDQTKRILQALLAQIEAVA